ncbi:MAG: molybdopterin-dependent oxidoreductase [Dehalococcoidia bacterium]|nr:molybdopterin-dependent oxidoreductase [Dehalococcoidia bacterium]
MSHLSRRTFLKLSAGTLAAVSAASVLDLAFLEEVPDIANPLESYPDRDWEKVYLDQYHYDESFTFICAPNDTHNCRLRAFVRNGIITRMEQAYDAGEVGDLYGNKLTPIWNPRGCLKGMTYVRRIYGPYRVKEPTIRKGWKEWADAGFPADEGGLPPRQYFRRGEDAWLQVSWDEANDYIARGLLHIADKYTGEEGHALLRAQGYPEPMIEATHGAGTQVLKIRPGMSLHGALRLQALKRFSNMLAMYDARQRGVDPEEALGARSWTNYDWHGDLPPGHPMVTGVQTHDDDHNNFRHTKLFIMQGVNFVENKMADAHWWIETMERGGKIVVIAPEYSPASTKADYWITLRPGTDPALILGVTNILIQEKLYDEPFVKKFTDFPLLVRLDTLKLLRASDIVPGYKNAELKGYSVTTQKIDPKLREKWGDFVVWDAARDRPHVITREHVGDELDVDPALEGSFNVRTVDGKPVQVKTVFQLYKELCAEYDLDTTFEITGSPKDLIQRLANDLATIKPACVHTGEGVNHYFHCDITTRGTFLWMALTGNLGQPGSGVGHWAGNYKFSVFNGLPAYNTEDPFQMNLDEEADGQEIAVKKHYKPENVAYWNYEDRPLIVNGKMFTGKTHMPTPTKLHWTANVNLLNNAKWAYNMAANVDPKVEMIIINEMEWTASCEFGDIVLPVESWAELSLPEMTASCSNPFLQTWKGGIDPLFNSRNDATIMADVAERISELTGDGRFRDFFKFILEDKAEVYLQRILDAGSTTRGYKIKELLDQDCASLMLFRTYPRIPGWEQINESKPFYNKTGRIEFYRDEDEFIEYGENMIVHREPVEATPYLPNVIVARHDAIRPNDYGISPASIDADERSVRNIKMPWSEAKNSVNPLWEQGFRYYCLTPKSRHTNHSSWAVTDWNWIWSSNFGDPYRRDKRAAGVGEHQMHINPEDARELGIEDGDYVYVDANPEDRPYKGWKEDDPFYHVSRLMLRVKYNPAYPRGVTMMKHSAFMATPKSVRAHETRKDGRALSEDTGYQSSFRYGSQQSITRGWLQPTMMTDSLVRKNVVGQVIGEGYEEDTHSPNTCPKETLVRITKAEDGGLGGKGRWQPANSGFCPGNESEAMVKYLAGGYVEVE